MWLHCCHMAEIHCVLTIMTYSHLYFEIECKKHWFRWISNFKEWDQEHLSRTKKIMFVLSGYIIYLCILTTGRICGTGIYTTYTLAYTNCLLPQMHSHDSNMQDHCKDSCTYPVWPLLLCLAEKKGKRDVCWSDYYPELVMVPLPQRSQKHEKNLYSFNKT